MNVEQLADARQNFGSRRSSVDFAIITRREDPVNLGEQGEAASRQYSVRDNSDNG
jgi:hypothetical protein